MKLGALAGRGRRHRQGNGVPTDLTEAELIPFSLRQRLPRKSPWPHFSGANGLAPPRVVGMHMVQELGEHSRREISGGGARPALSLSFLPRALPVRGAAVEEEHVERGPSSARPPKL